MKRRGGIQLQHMGSPVEPSWSVSPDQFTALFCNANVPVQVEASTLSVPLKARWLEKTAHAEPESVALERDEGKLPLLLPSHSRPEWLPCMTNPSTSAATRPN